MPTEMSQEFARKWHAAAAAIAGRALETSDKETFDILNLMGMLCEACSESQTPYRLYSRLQQIHGIIVKENEPPPEIPPFVDLNKLLPATTESNNAYPQHSPSCVCPDCTKLHPLTTDLEDSYEYCG
jgi:hypothetical protein